MDNLMKMYRNTRVNDYFKNYTHAQIDVAHRILEYLEPDTYFPPNNLNNNIMDKFLKRDVIGAVDGIINELCIDISSSSGSEGLNREAVEFANEVLEDFFERKKNEKLSERERLLIRLGELDKELEE